MSTPQRRPSWSRTDTCCCGSQRPSTFVSLGFARAPADSSRPRSSIAERAASSDGNRSCDTLAPSRTVTRRLPANRAHRARRLDEARLAHVVLQLLAPHRVADERRQLRVRRAAAQRLAEVRLVNREEARAQFALGRQPHAVAVGAERLGDGGDEADPPRPGGEAEHARGGRRLARQLLERVHRIDDRAQLLAGQHLVGAPRVVRVERHELDEAHLERGGARELGERQSLLLCEPAHRDCVDLDRVHRRVARQCVEPAHHLRQRVAAGDLEEAVALQRVDRHVDPADARVDERVGVALEQVPVGGQRQVTQPGHAGEHGHEPREVAADQRLAARQPQLVDTQRGEHAHEPLDLLEREQRAALETRQAVSRHAVLASETTPVRDRHAQIRDPASVAVYERVELHTDSLAPRPPQPRMPKLAQFALMAFRTIPFLEWCHRRLGDCFAVWMPPWGRLVYIADPDEIKRVFTGDPKQFHAGEANALVLERVLGSHSLLVLDEDEHLAERKRLLPHFHGESVRRYAETMAQGAAAEIETWPAGKAVKMRPAMQRIGLETILRAVIGVTEPARLAGLRQLLSELTSPTLLVQAMMFWEPLERVGPWKRYVRKLEEIDRLLYEEIAARRAAPSGEDILSLLVSNTELTDEQVRDELLTLLVAGHETTATGLAWG